MAGKIRWTNPAQPQTLVIATFLLYLDAVFGGFILLVNAGSYTSVGLLLTLAVIGAQVTGGWGIANELKWGYWLGLAAAFFPFALRWYFLGNPFAGGEILNLMFEVALVALLLHPMSRNYQRDWFK